MWLARKYSKGCDSYLISLFNRVPHITKDFIDPDRDMWFSVHDEITLSPENSSLFPISFEEGPIECSLVIDRKSPMYFIERVGEDIFIDDVCYSVFCQINGKRERKIPHYHRLRPSEFKWVTEDLGIIGVSIKLC